MSEIGNLTVYVNPPEGIETRIDEGLRRFNEEQVGSIKPLVVVIAASDEGGEIIGGIKGVVLWGWVYVERLWVGEEHRGHGLGGALLDRLESEVTERSARRSVLLSTSWQAPHFYTKRGYETVASFELDIPSGPRRGNAVDYLLVKSLKLPGERAV